MEHLKEELPAKTPRNQHLKKDNPKNNVFSFRATDEVAGKIKRAIEVQKNKQRREKYDAGDLLIDMIQYMDANLFVTFKIK